MLLKSLSFNIQGFFDGMGKVGKEPMCNKQSINCHPSSGMVQPIQMYQTQTPAAQNG